MEALASSTRRTRQSASGRPLQAIAPKSHTTRRRVFSLVVPTYSRRPPACSTRIWSMNSRLTSRSMSSRSGSELATAWYFSRFVGLTRNKSF